MFGFDCADLVVCSLDSFLVVSGDLIVWDVVIALGLCCCVVPLQGFGCFLLLLWLGLLICDFAFACW